MKEAMRLKFADGTGWVVKDSSNYHPEYSLFQSEAAATKFAADPPGTPHWDENEEAAEGEPTTA